MKAVLLTYAKEALESRKIVEIDENHDFSNGPYQDTVPFSVGSNQSIIMYSDLEEYVYRVNNYSQEECAELNKTPGLFGAVHIPMPASMLKYEYELGLTAKETWEEIKSNAGI